MGKRHLKQHLAREVAVLAEAIHRHLVKALAVPVDKQERHSERERYGDLSWAGGLGKGGHRFAEHFAKLAQVRSDNVEAGHLGV